MVVPDRQAQRELLQRTRMHLARAMHNRVAHGRVAQARVARRLGDPRLVIASHQQTLDDRLARLAARARTSIARRRDHLVRVERRLSSLHPRAILARERAELTRLDHRLGTLWSGAFARRGAELHRAAARLDAYSPLKVLARGYAIATREDGRAIRTRDDVAPGQRIHLRVRDARLDARVESVEAIEPGPSIDPAQGKRS
jgi:exodeoxyribonuclease VII large subunit